MSDGDHVPTPDKQVGFPERDTPLHHLGRAGDYEERIAILLELRPLVGFESILDGKLVQPELGLELPKELKAWLVQPDPHHMSRPAGPLARLCKRDVGDTPATQIRRRRDDAVIKNR